MEGSTTIGSALALGAGCTKVSARPAFRDRRSVISTRIHSLVASASAVGLAELPGGGGTIPSQAASGLAGAAAFAIGFGGTESQDVGPPGSIPQGGDAIFCQSVVSAGDFFPHLGVGEVGAALARRTGCILAARRQEAGGKRSTNGG